MYMQKKIEQQELERKLKIGYILPNLRARRTAFISYALFEYADTERFEVYCYTQGNADILRKRCQNKPLIWRDLEERPDFAVQLVENDRLDYLVDLSEHSTKAAIAVLQRRCAPVQLSTLGYFNTTGINNVDYILSDRTCTPETGNHRYFSERIIYIPQTFMAYTPLFNDTMVEELPLSRNGYVTFGCLHHFSRLSDEVLLIWQRIMMQVPRSTLVLKSRIFSSAYGCEETRYRLKRLGFDISRIEFRTVRHSDIDEYKNIDIILDTFPYQSVMTTCDALYMGVPVIAFAGKKHSMRMGCSILHQVGLADLVAYDVENYVEKAVSLANNKYRLANLHKNLRENMLKAPLMNGQRFVHNVENIYLYLRESEEKRQKEARLLHEMGNSLYNAEEKLAFLHGRLVAGDTMKPTLNIFSEVLYTFRNIKFALMRFENVDFRIIDNLISICSQTKEKANAGNITKSCEEISGQLMPQIKQLLQFLDEMKVSTLN